MTDQPSPALAEAREIVRSMTAGPWFEGPNGPGAAIRAPRAAPVHDTPYVTVAELTDQSLGDPLPDEANAAGIVLAVALLRTVVAEETVEAVARMLAERELRAKGFTPEGLRNKVAGSDVTHWERSLEMKTAECREGARAVLTALLERAREGT